MISPTISHSLLHSGDAEQAANPWSSQSTNRRPSPSTVTNRLRDDTDPVLCDDVSWQDRDMILPLSPPPQSTRPTYTQPQSPLQGADPTPEDASIASLKAIFPDFDDAAILSVLESTGNDYDRALDVLLGMNDPSFVPPNPPPVLEEPNLLQSAPSSDAQRLSQEALDEQLARRLALEEQQTATQVWQPQDVQGQAVYQPYQPRRGGRNGRGVQPQGPSQTQGQGGRDTMTEFQDGFNRIAESGKKTFSSIVSKVRAKMQDFDQGSGWSWPQNPPPGQPHQSTSTSYSSAYYAPAQQQGINDKTIYTAPAAVPAAVPASASTTATTQSLATPPHADYLASPPSSDKSSPPSYASPVSSPPPEPGLSPTVRSLSPTLTIAGAKGTATGAPGSVDFSKLGLLPKRPISLVRPQSPPATGTGTGANLSAPRAAIAHSTSTTDSSTDREEPEFVENPFEDR